MNGGICGLQVGDGCEDGILPNSIIAIKIRTKFRVSSQTLVSREPDSNL